MLLVDNYFINMNIIPLEKVIMATKKAEVTKTKKQLQATPKSKMNAKVDTAVDVTAEQRQRMIAEAAYYRAQKRGFDPAGQQKDWLEAEKSVDNLLKQH
jgi:hypothetical protein